jgi:integrase
MPASQVNSALCARYVDQRRADGASNATINREMAAMKRMFRIAHASSPAGVLRIPVFPHLRERNVRQGFISVPQYQALIDNCAEPWLQAMVGVAFTYGWRSSELLHLRVSQFDQDARTLRLEPGSTKNGAGREVSIESQDLMQRLLQCSAGKQAGNHLFTRGDRPVRDFRRRWRTLCAQSGCQGLLFHDLRRSAARNLRAAGVAEEVIMKIGGWKTASVFKRYALVNGSDIRGALRALESGRDQSQYPARANSQGGVQSSFLE